MGVSCKRGVVGKQAGAFPRCKVVVPASGLYGDERERWAADTLAFAEDVEAVSVVNMQIDDVVEAVAVVLFAAFASVIARIARRLRRPNSDARPLNIKRKEGCRGIFGTGHFRIRGRHLAIFHGNHFGR